MLRVAKVALITKTIVKSTLPQTNRAHLFHTQPLHFNEKKPVLTDTLKTSLQNFFFSPKTRPAFNLREKIPQTKDAQQVLMENPGLTFIGVFNSETKEITLMPAMKQTNLELHYNDVGDVIKGRGSFGKALTEEELKVINSEYKLFLARRSYMSESNSFQAPHTLLLSRMGIEKTNPFYGFSVMHNTDGSMKFRWNSASLNNNKPGTIANKMCPEVQEEIEKIICSWFSAEVVNDAKQKPF